MQIQDLIILIYIILRVAPSSYLCYYPFLEDLRLSKKAAICGFFAIILIEWGIFIFTGRNFDKLPTLYGVYLLYIFYYFAIVNSNKSKQLFASCSQAILKMCCRHWLCSQNAFRPLPVTTMLPPPSCSCWHNLLIFPGFTIL